MKLSHLPNHFMLACGLGTPQMRLEVLLERLKRQFPDHTIEYNIKTKQTGKLKPRKSINIQVSHGDLTRALHYSLRIPFEKNENDFYNYQAGSTGYNNYEISAEITPKNIEFLNNFLAIVTKNSNASNYRDALIKAQKFIGARNEQVHVDFWPHTDTAEFVRYGTTQQKKLAGWLELDQLENHLEHRAPQLLEAPATELMFPHLAAQFAVADPVSPPQPETPQSYEEPERTSETPTDSSAGLSTDNFSEGNVAPTIDEQERLFNLRYRVGRCENALEKLQKTFVDDKLKIAFEISPLEDALCAEIKINVSGRPLGRAMLYSLQSSFQHNPSLKIDPKDPYDRTITVTLDTADLEAFCEYLEAALYDEPTVAQFREYLQAVEECREATRVGVPVSAKRKNGRTIFFMVFDDQNYEDHEGQELQNFLKPYLPEELNPTIQSGYRTFGKVGQKPLGDFLNPSQG